jgi:hypothetical protein
MRRFWFVTASLVAAVFILILGFAAWATLRAPYVVMVGTPIRHDDFLFTVTRIGRQQLAGGTTLYRVGVNVQNEAKVVNYRWRDDIAYVRAFDGQGFGHNFSSSTYGSFVLAPGEARTARLEFRIPPDVSSPALHFWDGIFMGDALNGAAYTKAVVPLGAYNPPFGT